MTQYKKELICDECFQKFLVPLEDVKDLKEHICSACMNETESEKEQNDCSCGTRSNCCTLNKCS